MYVSVSRLRVEPTRVRELIAAFQSRAHLVDDVDGFLDLQVWHSSGDETEVLMVSRWRDRDCFRAYMRSADHAASHARIAPTLQRSVRLEKLEHMAGYEVVAE
jgi:heme-degrading monooxygenase HmoA